MDHSISEYQRIYQALQSSMSSISGEEWDSVQQQLHEATKNLDQAFQYELLNKKRIYD
ncbi:hypothetical protein [Bacillus sp. KH172YL63]|uniref:hypothetical protein n=1 Tax=Bacillus sp. KH172YL63 TaxID=2709784 RepID=UPI0013E4E460|nr:hypothetical protein [Bacillus sp. KH172YL63]BCB04481.1 hypothetical protein KH172YL63_26140 [Bacillus sp. KH172YL63]